MRPETVVARHRRLGRWRQRRRLRAVGRPPLPKDVQALIRRMAGGNPLWGQDRIAGELGKLGLVVSPRTVAKYVGHRAPGPPSVGWMAFLCAHVGHIWACDWLWVKRLTSNRSPSEWAEVFGDALLASAALDRLTHHARVTVITGESYGSKCC